LQESIQKTQENSRSKEGRGQKSKPPKNTPFLIDEAHCSSTRTNISLFMCQNSSCGRLLHQVLEQVDKCHHCTTKCVSPFFRVASHNKWDRRALKIEGSKASLPACLDHQQMHMAIGYNATDSSAKHQWQWSCVAETFANVANDLEP
jgi:hypothetical protein